MPLEQKFRCEINALFYKANFQLKNAKNEGLPVEELHAKISSELEEWKIDRQALNRAQVSASLFEEENRKLHREILSLQVHESQNSMKFNDKFCQV